MNETLIRAVIAMLKYTDRAADNLLPQKIVNMCKNHARVAAASGFASGWVPGAGGTIALAVSAGAIWTMYYKVNEEIGLPFSKNILKSIATAIGTNLLSYFASILIGSAISFIPGLGSAAAMAIIAIACYVLTILSAYIYFRTLTALFAKGYTVNTLNADDVVSAAKEVIEDEDINDLIKKAKADAKKAKENGEFKKQDLGEND